MNLTMPLSALQLVQPEAAQTPNAVNVLVEFFSGVQWATSLFEVKMLAAQALEELQALL